MKVVLDTNVAVSGLLLPGSVPGRILQAWRDVQFTWVLSETLINEIGRVLKYSKINQHLGWSETTCDRFIALLRFKTEIVEIKPMSNLPKLRDPKDVPFLATFIAGNADWLVSGDLDLLELRQQFPIVTPADFAHIL